MKYDSLRKISRNKALVAFRRAHPDWSWNAIAAEYDISRQCAHAIYMRATGHKGYGYRKSKAVSSNIDT